MVSHVRGIRVGQEIVTVVDYRIEINRVIVTVGGFKVGKIIIVQFTQVIIGMVSDFYKITSYLTKYDCAVCNFLKLLDNTHDRIYSVSGMIKGVLIIIHDYLRIHSKHILTGGCGKNRDCGYYR